MVLKGLRIYEKSYIHSFSIQFGGEKVKIFKLLAKKDKILKENTYLLFYTTYNSRVVKSGCLSWEN